MTDPQWTAQRIHELYSDRNLSEVQFLTLARTIGPIICIALSTGNFNGHGSWTADFSQVKIPSMGHELDADLQDAMRLLARFQYQGGQPLRQAVVLCNRALEMARPLSLARQCGDTSTADEPRRVEWLAQCVSCKELINEDLKKALRKPGSWRFAPLWPLLLQLELRSRLLVCRSRFQKERMDESLRDCITELAKVVNLYMKQFTVSGYPQLQPVAAKAAQTHTRRNAKEMTIVMQDARVVQEKEEDALRERKKQNDDFVAKVNTKVLKVMGEPASVAGAEDQAALWRPFVELRSRFALAGASAVDLRRCETRCLQGGTESVLSVLALEAGLNVTASALTIYANSPLARWVEYAAKNSVISDEQPFKRLSFEANWCLAWQTEAKGYKVRDDGGHSKMMMITAARGPHKKPISAAKVKKLFMEKDEVIFWETCLPQLPDILAIVMGTSNFPAMPNNASDCVMVTTPAQLEPGDADADDVKARSELDALESDDGAPADETARARARVKYGFAKVGLADLGRRYAQGGDAVKLMVKEAEASCAMGQKRGGGGVPANTLENFQTLCRRCEGQCLAGTSQETYPLNPEADPSVVAFTIHNPNSINLLNQSRKLLEELNAGLLDFDARALKTLSPAQKKLVKRAPKVPEKAAEKMDYLKAELQRTQALILVNQQMKWAPTWGEPWPHDDANNKLLFDKRPRVAKKKQGSR